MMCFFRSIPCLAVVGGLLIAGRVCAAADANAGVYVRDSGVAVENFALADRLEHLGEWSKAADVYQELLQKQADRVIALPQDATRFQSVVSAVQDRLCKWSPEALAVYRDRFGPDAQSQLDRALAEHREDQRDDTSALHLLFARDFVTDAGKIAGIRLIDAALESGNFVSAAAIGQRLLDRHPLLLADRPSVLYRTALADHFAGHDSAAAAKLAELKEKYPQTLGTVRGADVVLADSLQAELQHGLIFSVNARGESWPMPFGSADRSRTPAISGLAGARLFSVPLEPVPAHRNPGTAASMKQTADRNRALGMTLGIVPVVDRGELFFQDNAHVYAVSLESGRPLPGWQESFPGDAQGRYSIDAMPMPRSQLCTLCVTDDSVLGVMGFLDRSAVVVQPEMFNRLNREPRLICLDRRTGRERWIVDKARLPAEPAALRQLTLGGTPLVVGNNVYVAALGGSDLQIENCYVLCFDLISGAYKWSSYIASANDTLAMWDPEGTNGAATVAAQLAYSGGRLFVTTNVGAVAALDGLDGSIAWLDLYPRQPMPDLQVWARAQGNGEAGRRPWSTNPIIVKGEKVFTCPADASALLVYNAADGSPLEHVGMSYKTSADGNSNPEKADTLIGISDTPHGEAAILSSDRSVFCVQIDNYDPTKGDDSVLWVNSTLAKKGAPDDPIRGRAFLTRDAVVVSLTWGLESISLRTGAAQATFPPTGTWDVNDEGPGNVLLTPDHLIIAGAQHVSVYTDLAVARARLDRAIEQSPRDPELRLRYAEVLLAARQFDGPAGALAKLDEAAKLLSESRSSDAVDAGTADSSSADSTKTLSNRLFTDALNFAVSSDISTDISPDRSIINALFDRAGKAAATPAEQVTYRLRRAASFERFNDPAAELALYQQVLLEPRYRSVTVSESERGVEPASGFVYQAINDLLKRTGVSLYQQYETAAGQALASAQAIGAVGAQRDQLLDLCDRYPNSAAARQAMMAAARDDEALNDPRSAAGLLRQYSTRYPSDSRALVFESLARLYLQMPNRADRLSVAIGRLEQGAKLPDSPKIDQPLKLPDGSTLQNVTFAEAVNDLRKFQAVAEQSQLADFQVQSYVRARSSTQPVVQPAVLPEEPAATLSDVADLLVPLEGWNRHDRIVTYSTTHELSVYAIAANKPQWTTAAIDEPPLHVAWIDGNLLVWCPGRVVLLRGDTSPNAAGSSAAGTIIWDAPLKSLPGAQLASIGSGVADSAIGNGVADEPNKPQSPQIPQQIVASRTAGGGWVFAGNGGQPIRVIGPRAFRIAMRGGAAVANIAADPVAEHIDHLAAGSERIVFTTSGSNASGVNAGGEGEDSGDTGSRIVSLDSTDGHVVWQSRLGDRTIDQLAANDDFVAVRATNAEEVRLIALDAQSGQVLWHPRAFGRENNDPSVPINFALSADGSLVYAMADRICCKDLFDPDPALRFDRPVTPGNVAQTFVGSTAADQLLVRDGRVIIVSDGGTLVRLYSLSDGLPLDRGEGNEPRLGTRITLDPFGAHLRLVGNDLYVFGHDAICHYGLTDPQNFWPQPINTADGATVAVRDVQITPLNAVALLVPVDFQMNGAGIAVNNGVIVNGVVMNGVQMNGVAGAAAAEALPSVNTEIIRAFSRRASVTGRESGEIVNNDRFIRDPSGITNVQIVDGGVYYCTGGHEVRFLRGVGGGGR